MENETSVNSFGYSSLTDNRSKLQNHAYFLYRVDITFTEFIHVSWSVPFKINLFNLNKIHSSAESSHEIFMQC